MENPPGLDIFLVNVDEDGFYCGESLNNLINWICGELYYLGIDSVEEAFHLYQSLTGKWDDLVSSNYIEEGEETNQTGLSWWRANAHKIFILCAWDELTRCLPMLTVVSNDRVIVSESSDGSDITVPCWDRGVTHLIQAMHFKAMYDFDQNIHSKFSMAGGRASAAIRDQAKNMALDIAKDTWAEWKEDCTNPPCPSLDETAESIRGAISADPKALGLTPKSVPTKTTIKKWIRHLAPDEAVPKGRPKKR